MEKAIRIIALLLSLIMLVSFVGCCFSLRNDDNSSMVDTAGVISSNTKAQQIMSVVSKETSSETVWISKTGSKFHKSANCGNIQYPTQTTKQQAERQGYEPCKNCYYKE